MDDIALAALAATDDFLPAGTGFSAPDLGEPSGPPTRPRLVAPLSLPEPEPEVARRASGGAADAELTTALVGGMLLLGVAGFVYRRLRDGQPNAAPRQVRRLPADRPRVPRTVLAIGAHPDDIELGCGAALLRYHAEGYTTRACVLTAGENGFALSPGAEPDARRHEAARAGAVLGLDSLEMLGFPDTRLASRRQAIRRAIEEQVTRHRPDIVLTHTALDLHFDHRTVFTATLEACRHVPTLLCYENPNTPASFRPNLFIDVSPYIDLKIRALRCHATQNRRPYCNPELIRSIARMRGNQAHVGFAEGFEAIRVRSEAL